MSRWLVGIPATGLVMLAAASFLVGDLGDPPQIVDDACGPNGVCSGWQSDPAIIRMASDATIAASFLAMAAALAVFRSPSRRVDWPRVLFAVFLLSCGLAYVLAVVAFRQPIHWLDGKLNVVTAIAAVVAAATVAVLLAEQRRREDTEAGRRAAEAVFSVAASHSGEALLVLVPTLDGDRRDYVVTFANPMAKRMFAGGIEKAVGQPLHSSGLAAWLPGQAILAEVASTGVPHRETNRSHGRFGEERFVELTIARIDQRLLVSARDVTAARELDEQAIAAGRRDPLTGLDNRIPINERMTAAIAQARRGGTLVGVMFVDIDSFKRINDTEGHDIGDDILVAVAQRLTASVRETDMVFRYGGDEIVIIVTGIVYEGDLAIVATRMMRAMDRPIEVRDGRGLMVTLSIGGAVYPDDATAPVDLLKCADQAMYGSKTAGKNAFTLYSALSKDGGQPGADPDPSGLDIPSSAG